ncbi:MAG: hypothetical protein ABR538_16250 [Candidatus Binatia bacterium]
MWNLNGLRPESTLRLRLVAAVLVAASAAACGPSSGNLAVYNVVFTLGDSPDDADLSRLAFTVVYAGGSFVGNGAGVNCDLVETDDDETATFIDDDEDTLTVDITATEAALVEGADIVTCDFQADGQPSANDFTITVTAAKDDEDGVVNPALVGVVVTSTDVSGADPALGEVVE